MPDDPDLLIVMRFGGFAGLRASAEVRLSELTPEHRAEVSSLLEAPPHEAQARGADRFTYQLSCGDQIVRVPEPEVPHWLAQLVRVELPRDRQ